MRYWLYRKYIANMSVYQEFKREFYGLIEVALERSYFNCAVALGIPIGSVLVGISSYNVITGVSSQKDVIIFSVGLVLLSPFLITSLLLLFLSLCGCLAYFTCEDSKPIVEAPDAVWDGTSGRPKSNSPLSVLRAV